MEHQESPSVQALPRHRYPVWVIACGAVVLVTLVVSLFTLPNYSSATRDVRAARAAYRKGDFDTSASLYASAILLVPGSRTARLGGAKAMFSNSDRSDDLDGLALLEGLSLDSDEWSEVKQVMPAEFQQYFHEVGR
jgi:hypothetical protein